MTGLIVDHLRINGRQTSKDVQTRTFSCSHQFFSYTHMTACACERARIFCHSLLGSFPSLTGFATDLLTNITNALAVIWLGRSNAANLGRGLTNYLTVITKHLDLACL